VDKSRTFEIGFAVYEMHSRLLRRYTPRNDNLYTLSLRA
jgi:hypothetical protein